MVSKEILIEEIKRQIVNMTGVGNWIDLLCTIDTTVYVSLSTYNLYRYQKIHPSNSEKSAIRDLIIYTEKLRSELAEKWHRPDRFSHEYGWENFEYKCKRLIGKITLNRIYLENINTSNFDEKLDKILEDSNKLLLALNIMYHNPKLREKCREICIGYSGKNYSFYNCSQVANRVNGPVDELQKNILRHL